MHSELPSEHRSPDESGLSERTRSLITGYSVGSEPALSERTGLSAQTHDLIAGYVSAFGALRDERRAAKPRPSGR